MNADAEIEGLKAEIVGLRASLKGWKDQDEVQRDRIRQLTMSEQECVHLREEVRLLTGAVEAAWDVIVHASFWTRSAEWRALAKGWRRKHLRLMHARQRVTALGLSAARSPGRTDDET